MYYLPPLSLYIHIPWCIKKCYYCDFNSHELTKQVSYIDYINHLLLDLKNDFYLISNREIYTIFIGGGTPNLIDINSMDILINGIRKILNFSENIEITIEINPGITNDNILSFYKNVGINRISIGAQSFNINHLKSLGRIHNPKDIKNTIELVKKFELNNFNIDLMYGLPNQSIKEAINDLYQTISLNPSHISWYQLTIEPNTFFSSQCIDLPNEKILLSIFQKGHSLLRKAGYQQYEISNYSKPNYFCKHNLNYWYFGDYIGIGCGAHGKITQPDGQTLRTIKNRHPKKFMKGLYLSRKYFISENDKPFEYFINRFRLTSAVCRKEFEFSTGLKENFIRAHMDIAIEKGYIFETKENWQLSKKGKLFLNDLLELFIID
ncbi:YggW family oxidoreductase [Candidatus Pantoea edessiphila]|uniref:Heme chaperone HemW n=1 Tax=Candidatus Pantoea edessiphila TaxID=2044610 RepID=A0A2P5SZR9_9GAMM|nr:radical SAM family heme chaperone HemW [Candidatus Pantoea edessiphila]PPI87834.1 YggW family oxidoreductase [Candidatus Pantoea edessiphila]